MPAPRTPRYTREEADRALALLRPIAEDARERYLRLRKELRSLRRLDLLDELSADASVPPSLRDQLTDLAQCLRELRDLGGLLTLPGSLADGSSVHFCWKLGEARVRFWFGPGESYADRRPFARGAAKPPVPAGTRPAEAKRPDARTGGAASRPGRPA
jgi:hypothetical protein